MATFLHLTPAGQRTLAPGWRRVPRRVTHEEEAVADLMPLVPDGFEVVVTAGRGDVTE